MPRHRDLVGFQPIRPSAVNRQDQRPGPQTASCAKLLSRSIGFEPEPGVPERFKPGLIERCVMKHHITVARATNCDTLPRCQRYRCARMKPRNEAQFQPARVIAVHRPGGGRPAHRSTLASG